MRHMCLRLWIILLAGSGALFAARPWTVDAILNIDTLSDPQIRPDGQAYAWVQRNKVHVASIPSGGAKVVASGTRPRWSPDSSRLAYLSQQVHVIDLKNDRFVPRPLDPFAVFCVPCAVVGDVKAQARAS